MELTGINNQAKNNATSNSSSSIIFTSAGPAVNPVVGNEPTNIQPTSDSVFGGTVSEVPAREGTTTTEGSVKPTLS